MNYGLGTDVTSTWWASGQPADAAAYARTSVADSCEMMTSYQKSYLIWNKVQ